MEKYKCTASSSGNNYEFLFEDYSIAGTETDVLKKGEHKINYWYTKFSK